MPDTPSSIIPALRYRDAHAAMDWMCNILGFTRHAVYEGPEKSIAHAELTLGGGMVMLGSQRDDECGSGVRSPAESSGLETRSTYVVVPDADTVYARAQAGGAMVVRPIRDTEYGSREFTIQDPEGHSWSVGTYDPWTSHG